MIEVISEDGTVYASDRVYPFPIESSDRDCHVWAELISKNRKSFGIMGLGSCPTPRFGGSGLKREESRRWKVWRA
jgi:hypothetical protein